MPGSGSGFGGGQRCWAAFGPWSSAVSCACVGVCPCPSLCPSSCSRLYPCSKPLFIWFRMRMGQGSPGPPPVPVRDNENSTGGEEAAFPGGMSPELFPSPSGTGVAGPGEGAMSPSMERAALPTTLDLDTPPGEWGDSKWEEAKPTRKRALSGGQEHPRGSKTAPAVPLTNRFEALAGIGGDEENGEEGMGLDLMACSPEIWPPFEQDHASTMAVIVTTNVRGLRDPTKRAAVFASLGAMRGDIFLLQEVHLRDVEDAAALSHGRDGAGEGGIDYSARALAEVVRDFSLVDAYRVSHPSDAGITWRNSRGAASRLDYIFVGGGQSGMKCVLLPSWASDHDMLRVSLPADRPKWGPGFWRLNTSLLGSGAFVTAFTRCYSTVRALRPLYTSVVEWWEAAKSRFASFCRLHAVGARRRDGAEVTKWTGALAYLHGRLNRGESVDWAAYEGAKERLRGLLEARAKALAFQARLRELEEGERATAFFFQAARARRGASAIAGLRRRDGTLAEGPAMLAVAESYYAELFSRRACDPAAEARLLICVSARLGAEEAQAMEADVTLEEVREALMGLRDGRAPGHDGLLRSSMWLSGTSWGLIS
ncbi:hypothetical protein AAFF_G00434600 [Aldrovandia affinis]|uniref:Endonuclease/exonuclease/phosphatase domain-containing protein n=1 Tax=Aldrovandia affinis TaxID=143900 RepID=A0AAD7S846_9TELE|nr:hypothetical protein AAFF_G00434600 [Aldrovandia affinis]